MATPPSLRLEKLTSALQAAEIGMHPSEVQGTIVGLICGGVEHKSDAWIPPLLELINDGQSLPTELHALVGEIYLDALNRLTDFEFGFTLLLPEEEEPLNDRVEALSLWVQSYLAAISVVQPKLKSASADVKEVINDLAEIAQIELDVADDEESEIAYTELVEFVRVAAILCYSEFAPDLPADQTDKPEVLH
ncbi:MAG: UPF0149 family protein [Parashewanella sp.]